MTNEIPVAVYEQLFKANRDLLNQELDSVDLDFSRIHMRFNRMVNALEEVENYRMERARQELRRRREIEGE